MIVDDRLWNGRARPSAVEIDDFVTWATISIILGGRLGYVLFYDLDHYIADPVDIIRLWKGGMSFHGAIAGLSLAMWIYGRDRSFARMTLFDLITAAGPIGLFFGRIANFINGELWGRTTDVAWGVIFPRAGPLPRHPSQLYEMALEGIVLFFILRWLSHRRQAFNRPGLVAGTFAIGYGVARILAEFYREPDAQVGYMLGFITRGQTLSVPLILIGLFVVLRARRVQAATAPVATSTD